MVYRVFKRLVLVSSLTLSVVFIVLGVLSAMKQPADWWVSATQPVWLLPLFIISGLGSATVPAETLYLRSQLLERRTKLQLTEYSRYMFILAMAKRRSSAQDLSVHVWRVRRSWRGEAWLEREVTFRLVQRAPSEMRWVRGKGVVGKCWAIHDTVVANLEGLASTAKLGRTAYDDLSEDERFGLSWDEYHAANTHTAIFAAPLISRKGRVIGCVTVDSTGKGAYKQLEPMKKAVMVQENTLAMARALENGEAL